MPKSKSLPLQIRIEKRRRIPVRRAEHEADETLRLACRVAGADLGVRRRAEAVPHELRTEIAEAATMLADEHAEPRLDDDAR
jgi:hypothetical protein